MPVAQVRKILEEDWTLNDNNYSTGGPSRYTSVAETGQRVGFISPLSHNFCATCNRVRVTCTGKLFMCLGQDDNADLRAPLRASEGDELLHDVIDEAIGRKPKSHEFVIEPGNAGPALARHMNVTGG
jgi:cyclic pyranopterin phosphate synthase